MSSSVRGIVTNPANKVVTTLEANIKAEGVDAHKAREEFVQLPRVITDKEMKDGASMMQLSVIDAFSVR